MELLLEGQWGWSSVGKEPMNAYIAFDRNHTCWFLQALNATLYPERGTCEWEVVLTNVTGTTDSDGKTSVTRLTQLKLHLDDKWMQEKFADPLGYDAAVNRPAWINKFNQPPIEALLYGSWGWSSDGTEVTAHLEFLPTAATDGIENGTAHCRNGVCLACQFKDHWNKLVTGPNMAIPWCHWYIDYPNT